MNPKLFLKVSNVEQSNECGQELILFEILTVLIEGSKKGVWLPFGRNTHLAFFLNTHKVHANISFSKTPPKDCDTIYLGTPTIVNDSILFPDSIKDVKKCDIEWNKANEREFVKNICTKCEKEKYRTIVTGLGQGDISIEERMEDMGANTEIVCFKQFDGFYDFVLKRKLR